MEILLMILVRKEINKIYFIKFTSITKALQSGHRGSVKAVRAAGGVA